MVQFNIPDSLLPYNVIIDIPKKVSNILQLDSANKLAETPIRESGKLKLNIIKPQYYCQFYLDLNIEGKSRKNEFQLKMNQSLNKFHILIQQPLGSKSFTNSLNNTEIFNDEYNLTYHRELYPFLEKNNTLNINFSYEKESSLTTLEILEKILSNHNHGTDESNQFEHGQNSFISEDVTTKFNKSKYHSFTFGIPLIFIIIGIYTFSKNTNLIIGKEKRISNCSNCSQEYHLIKKQKNCSNCGSELNVS